MNRTDMLRAVEAAREPWELLVIGGGATGLGVAVDAASRGYRTLLVEQSDFAKGTSSRSTKLVHGGVRYLKQGNVSLVVEALKERGLLLRNAPHLVRNLPFVVPSYDWWEGPFYGVGLKMYDLLAGRQGIGRSRILSRRRTLELLPTLEPEGLTGGVIYHDGQFDDARLAINLARTAAEQGAALLNYVVVTGLLKVRGEVAGVRARDVESGQDLELEARVVVNATGVFADRIRRMDDAAARELISPSQGAHIVLDRSFLPGESAIMVPKTADGRVLFAIPWHDRVVVGTTDTPVGDVVLEPRPFAAEIEFLLEHAARYLVKDPAPADVRSIFAGLRPLVGGEEQGSPTSALSRDHTLSISHSGLVTITGGKWTTYRRMAQDTVDQAATIAGLEDRPCVTHDLPIHGHDAHAERFGPLAVYGSDAPAIEALLREDPRRADRLDPDFPTTLGEVVWAARHEMARTVEDVLARRTRMLLLDARASMRAAPAVAATLADELGKDDAWRDAQVQSFLELARGYTLG
ncbi:MAG TPA: glycerol-3-phosphate dehydrogenase/oxidase [Longimicrobiales bacterium]|nr:glycerol-3-phosphate dehydrogenase/oxidase [Longimicrobiales bacterium]